MKQPSVVMRRNVVPQPALVLGVTLGCPLIAFVGRRLGQRLAEDVVN